VDIILQTNTPKLVVLSAVSGTTNTLVSIVEHLRMEQQEQALALLYELHHSNLELLDTLFYTIQYKEKARLFANEKLHELKSMLLEKEVVTTENRILAQGELFSTQLVQFYLEECNIDSTLLSALDFMEIDGNQEPKMNRISAQLTPLLSPKETLWITQGFICKNESGAISNLQRGGSDYTASLIGAAIKAKEIQIWTDINGMHNNDPRYVDNTFSIEEISFDEAAELAYFGAKILHPQSLIPAKENNIPVLLKNTFSPESQGTIIKNQPVKNGITAIAAKDGITAIKIKSYRMLLAYGFLKKVFEVFETYKTPIDMITTSEVAISLTIDDISYLSEIIRKLEPFGKVAIDTNLSIICIAGDFSQKKEGISAGIFNALKGIPIRMISYGGSNYNTSLLVKTDDKIAALNALNTGLFNKKYAIPEAIG
jgi:aspartate kinase